MSGESRKFFFKNVKIRVREVTFHHCKVTSRTFMPGINRKNWGSFTNFHNLPPQPADLE
jgi:hypothetical protein